MSIDTAIPCGLVINELVSNSIKYAFPDNRRGVILISLKLAGDKGYILTVKDDGIGLDKNVDFSCSATLGIQLVNLLTKQLNGILEIKTEKDAGVEFIIKFEESVYKSRK
jgi:two-component sensor histidine kinase